jgi:sarcosine oxidase
VTESFDAIVVGLGAHGSAAALALARRGLRVLGLEAGERAHGLGSSGGRSRIIRLAYFEHPSYVPLLLEAWDRWLALEVETGVDVLEQTGGFYAGPADGEVFAGSLRSAREHDLPHEVLSADDLRRRWPAFAIDDEVGGLFEERAGFLRPELAIDTHLAAAERLGAELRFGERAVDWRPAGSGAEAGLEIETDAGVYRGDRLVLTAGAWIDDFLPDLRLPLWVERVPLFWFEPTVPAQELGVGRLPVWIMDTSFDGAYYGFPYDPEAGLKVARHHSGERCDPSTVDRSDRPADVERVRTFLRRHFPAADGALRGGSVCMYANTPDLDFIVDAHPDFPNVVFASACSGHGFKFAPVIGETLADLAIDGRTDRPIDFLRASRFAGAASPG